MADIERRRFQHKGRKFVAVFRKRPFREGREVTVRVGDRELRVAELGLGVKATIAKLKVLLDTMDD